MMGAPMAVENMVADAILNHNMETRDTSDIPCAPAGASIAAPLSIDRFSHLLGAIYDTAQDTDRWAACLEQLRREFGGNYASLIVRQAAGTDLGYIISAAGEVRVL